ncbi:hypothetical protein EVAR_83842_1 [Eumeta japonica]|uniref:Uncharacterized protein n=1 Tax=Eumeta variegata TaxID=151549 RepID=A0A4C1UR44_EUMVA|nr:hypothetical protein EVAR_83842_1 [Eumeta japonica]
MKHGHRRVSFCRLHPLAVFLLEMEKRSELKSSRLPGFEHSRELRTTTVSNAMATPEVRVWRALLGTESVVYVELTYKTHSLTRLYLISSGLSRCP